MTTNESYKRGESRVRRIIASRRSERAADRAWANRISQRLRAWVDIMLGSAVSGDDKDDMLRETLSAVMSGKSHISTRVYESEDEFLLELRCLIRENCEILLGGP